MYMIILNKNLHNFSYSGTDQVEIYMILFLIIQSNKQQTIGGNKFCALSF